MKEVDVRKNKQKELAENENNISDDAMLVKNAHDKRQRLTGKTKFEFEIGCIAASEKLLDQMERTKKLMLERDKTPNGSFISFVWKSFARHCLCDWGDISQEDKGTDNKSLKTGGVLFSMYTHAVYPTIGIMTDADRTETAIGLLDEFE